MADERADRDHLQPFLPHVLEGSGDESGADAPPLELLRDDRMVEADSAVLLAVGGDRGAPVLLELETLFGSVIGDHAMLPSFPTETRAMRKGSSFVAALLLLASCRESEPAGNAALSTASADQACESRTFEGSAFTVCAFDARSHEIRLAWRGEDGAALRSLPALEAALGADAERVRFAMNAGMYDEDGAPIGLYVEKGERLKPISLNPGPGNFHLLPNGVFAVDREGRVSVTPSREFAGKAKNPLWATQSGPMLVIDGKLHPKFDADGPSRLVRNGVGVKDPRTAWFAISEEGVSFGRFARFFRDELGARNALYLDGTVSSLWAPGSERQDAYPRLGPMVVVLSR